jgi:sugar transferase (PEP-CTERM/EpsH1 system associated)
MRILILDEEFPYPLNTGKRIRSFNLARELAGSNEVTYLAYGRQDTDSCRALAGSGITPVPVRPPHMKKEGPRFYLKLFLNLFSRYPFMVTNHYSNHFQNEVTRHIESGSFDIVMAEWTPYAIFLKEPSRICKVIVAHNIESSIWRRYEETETNLFRKLYIMLQRSKVELFEKKCFRWVNGATAVSHEEAREIATFGIDYPVATIDNGVDTEYFVPRDELPDPNTLVFTGSMDWRPNQDAVLWFVEDILPRIHSAKPDIRVVIVGRRPPGQIKALENRQGVTVTGTVDDVRPYIARGAVYIVPLRIGGGSRLKILEAMGMKKAVVSTSVGAEGLDVVDGETILIADGAEAFAQTVLKALDDCSLCRTLGERARLLVEEHYRWSSLGKKLARYLTEVCSAQ